MTGAAVVEEVAGEDGVEGQPRRKPRSQAGCTRKASRRISVVAVNATLGAQELKGYGRKADLVSTGAY